MASALKNTGRTNVPARVYGELLDPRYKLSVRRDAGKLLSEMDELAKGETSADLMKWTDAGAKAEKLNEMFIKPLETRCAAAEAELSKLRAMSVRTSPDDLRMLQLEDDVSKMKKLTTQAKILEAGEGLDDVRDTLRLQARPLRERIRFGKTAMVGLQSYLLYNDIVELVDIEKQREVTEQQARDVLKEMEARLLADGRFTKDAAGNFFHTSGAVVNITAARKQLVSVDQAY